MADLKNKVGDGTGIGRATALAMARAGAALVIGNRDAIKGEEVVQLIRQCNWRIRKNGTCPETSWSEEPVGKEGSDNRGGGSHSEIVLGSKETLVRMRHLRSLELSFAIIAKGLNEEQVPMTTGKAWHGETVRGILGR
jgi:hypothetical protein